MASKSAQQEQEKAEVVEELLEYLDKTLDRVKVLYEQFFLGMQKQPPTQIHTEVERKLRDLQQMQIRNTALRYRLATIQQKFGSYNTYWRRTVRQIENGTYHRNLAKIGRQAALTGEEIPDEILAAMPKRMRDQVKRDRELALAMKARREAGMEVDDNDVLEEADASPMPANARKRSDGAFHLDEDDEDFDVDALFRAVTNNDDEQTNPAAAAFSDATSPSLPRAPTFDGELATDDDIAPPPRSMPVQHPNAAVRAAVGMRVTTPPAGVPVAQRITPTQMPAQRPSGSFSAQPGGASGSDPARGNPSGGYPARSNPSGGYAGGDPGDDRSGGYARSNPSGGYPGGDPSGGYAGGNPSGGYADGASGGYAARSHPSGGYPAGGDPSGPSQAGGSQRPGPARTQAPSQVARPLPVIPGASSSRPAVPVETMNGPFPRDATQPIPPIPHPPSGRIPARPVTPSPVPSVPPIPTIPPNRASTPNVAPNRASTPNVAPTRPSSPHVVPRIPSSPPSDPQRMPPPDRSQPMPTQRAQPKPMRATTSPGVPAPQRLGPPPGMTDADVNALYAKYVKAKEAVGEKAGPGAYGKLLQTINAQAPKIMEQYKAKGVDFQVVVKDNQVVIRAKPKP